jgi:hypothetical protein
VKIEHYIYSPDQDDENPEVPGASPTSLNHRDVCIPLGDCVAAALGPVDPALCAWLESNQFDQAPVAVPSAEIGWRLVARSQLHELCKRGEPLTEDDAHFLPIDRLRFPYTGGWIAVDALIEEMTVRAAAIVYTETQFYSVGSDLTEPSGMSREICGLITRSDLNRQVVRAGVYDQFSGLEANIAKLVAIVHEDHWEWIGLLNEEAQVRVLGFWEVSKRNGVDMGPIAGATLTDLLSVVSKSLPLLRRLDFGTKKKFEEVAGRLPRTRNRVMHAVRPLILTEQDVVDLARVHRSLKGLHQRVSNALRQHHDGAVS